MSRKLLFVPLLLGTGLMLAADGPEAGPVDPAAEEKPRDEVSKAERVDPAIETKPRDDVPEVERVGPAAEAGKQTKVGPKLISGMSILGSQEAPKSLVIVPWKSSEIGNSLGIAPMLDDYRRVRTSSAITPPLSATRG